MNRGTILYTIPNLVEGTVVKRPSALIKTPYVADVHLELDDANHLGHSLSLGCDGMCDAGATVYMSPATQTKAKTKKQEEGKYICDYSVQLSRTREGILVGINPKVAEHIANTCLQQELIPGLNIKSYRRELPMYIEGHVDSRFDFGGVLSDERPFIMEVKAVPLADYANASAKEKKKMDFTGREIGSKIAYFPEGWRKKATDTVSPRALKHVKELTYIKQNTNTHCVLCFIVQRSDVARFELSATDPEYKAAVEAGIAAGIQVVAIVVDWSIESGIGQAKLENIYCLN